MKTLILIMSVLLSGCGANGTPLLLAAIYDNADKCQQVTHQDVLNHNVPNYCGAGSGTRYYTRDYRTNAIIATTQANVFGPNTFSSNAYYH